jgi:hypothetical protein
MWPGRRRSKSRTDQSADNFIKTGENRGGWTKVRSFLNGAVVGLHIKPTSQ